MRVAPPVAAFPSAAFIEPRHDLNGGLEVFLPVVSDVRGVSTAEAKASAGVSTPGARAAAVTAPGDALPKCCPGGMSQELCDDMHAGRSPCDHPACVASRQSVDYAKAFPFLAGELGEVG